MAFLTLVSFIFVALLSAIGSHAAQEQLQQVFDFGPNPNNVSMFLYRPKRVVPSPPLVVALHYCGGTAQAYFNGTEYADLADSLGFLLVFPSTPAGRGCWDVNTEATLTHNGGSDSLAIASIVRFATANWHVNRNKVFMTGTSSGAMMTNVLAGAYPDLFRAGAAFAGVPYACFAGPNAWNNDCSSGIIMKTAQQWGDLVRSGYPGYKGDRPKMQIWQGTLDTTLNYVDNFEEGIKQWTNIFHYPLTPRKVQLNSPLPGWTRSTFGPDFQAISAAGVDHNIPVQAKDVLQWFGIMKKGRRSNDEDEAE